MTVKQKNKIYSILICLLGVAAVVLALVIALQPSPEKEAISDAKKMASEAAEAKENEEKLKAENAKQETEKQESSAQKESMKEESGKESAKREESVKTEESVKQESSNDEKTEETEKSSDTEESSKTEESSDTEESSEKEEGAPIHVASGSGTIVSDSGTNLNLIVDWSIDTDASGNETLTLTASLETYGLSASSREEGLYVTIGDDVEIFSTDAVENTEDELAVIPLKTVTLDWPGGTHNVQVSWRFGGVYGGVELDYIIAEGRLSD